MPSPTQEIGQRHERLAEVALRRAGYQIEARNWRGGGGEIDRIAKDGDILVFVEVRSRRGTKQGRPSETVRWTKQRRVIIAALAYLAERPPGPSPAVRFDVVSVIDIDSGEPEVEIIRGAFDAGLLFRGRSIPLL